MQCALLFFSLCFFLHTEMKRLFNLGPLDLHTPSSPHTTFSFSPARTGFPGLTSRLDLPTINLTAAIFQAVWPIIVSSDIVSCNSLILALQFPQNYTGSDLWDLCSIFTRSTVPQWGRLWHQAPTDLVPELSGHGVLLRKQCEQC